MKRLLVHLTNSKNETRDFVFHSGTNAIDPSDRALFDFTSEEIASGGLSFDVDGIAISPFENEGGKVFELSVVSKGLCEFEAVFFLKSDENLADKAKAIRIDLSTLRDLPIEDESARMEKLDRIFEILKKWEVGYLLIDFSAENNRDHHNALLEKLVLLDDVVSLTLPYVPSKADAEDEDVIIRSDRALFPYAKQAIKEQSLNLVFAAIFSLIGSFGLTYGITLLNTEQTRGGIFSMILSVFCLFMIGDVSLSSYREKKALLPGNSYLLVILFSATTFLSSLLSCLITYLMNKDQADVLFLLAVGLVFGLFIAAFQLLSRFLAIRAKVRGKTA